MSETTANPDIPWDVFAFVHVHQTAEKGMAVDLATNLHEQSMKLQIEVELMRSQVVGLLSGRYMPTPEAVINALRVEKKDVNRVYEARVEGMRLK